MNLVIKTDSHQNNLLKHVTEKRTKKNMLISSPKHPQKHSHNDLSFLVQKYIDNMSSQCVSPPSKTLRNLISYNSLISALMMSCPCFCVFPGWRDCHNIMAIHVYVNSRIIVCIYIYIYSYITRKKLLEWNVLPFVCVCWHVFPISVICQTDAPAQLRLKRIDRWSPWDWCFQVFEDVNKIPTFLSERFVEHVSITKQTSQSREVGCSSGALSVGQDFVNRWDLEAWGLRWFESENGDTIRIHQIPSSEKAILTGTMMRNQQIWGYAYVYAPTYIYIWSRPPSLHPP